MSTVDMEVTAFRAYDIDSARTAHAEVMTDLSFKLKRAGIKDAGHENHAIVIFVGVDDEDTDVILTEAGHWNTEAEDRKSYRLLDHLLTARRAIDIALTGMGVDR